MKYNAVFRTTKKDASAQRWGDQQGAVKLPRESFASHPCSWDCCAKWIFSFISWDFHLLHTRFGLYPISHGKLFRNYFSRQSSAGEQQVSPSPLSPLAPCLWRTWTIPTLSHVLSLSDTLVFYYQASKCAWNKNTAADAVSSKIATFMMTSPRHVTKG